MLRKFMGASAIVLMCAGFSFGQLVIDQDLGTLGVGATNVTGDTTGFGIECDYYNLLNPALFWGDEVNYQFTVTAPLNEINIMSNSLTEDPDFFILDSTDVEDDGTGKLIATGNLGNFFLDAGPPELGTPIVVPAGTYYLSAAAYNGTSQAGIQAAFDIDLLIDEVEVADPPAGAIDLGMIADADVPFSIDTFGSLFDTELGLYSSVGILVASNDDAGGVLQSEIVLDGLDAGTYYLAVGEFDTVYNFGFDATSTGAAGGDFVLNYNGNVENGNVPAGGVSWYSFVIGGTQSSVVVPASLTVTAGNLSSGGAAELADNDSADLSIFRSNQSVSARTEFVVEAVSPTATPSSFDVTLEGSCFARTTVVQSIALWNYSTSSYDEVSSSNASLFFDNEVTASATGTLSDYVGPGNAIQARIRFQGGVPRLSFASNTDQFNWTIE